MKNIQNFINKYRHIVPLITYYAIFLVWFGYLEETVTTKYQVIHLTIDDYIPFVEIFVIPYILWFGYVAVVIAYFFFTHKDNYHRTCIFLFTGMTIFLIISTLWPNGQQLRPHIMPRDNLFTQLISHVYQNDTATNIWPSIHVYNSLGVHLAVAKSEKLSKNKLIQWASGILCISIVLSTTFIKQHSVFDIITAFILAGVMYIIVYKYDILNAYRSCKLAYIKKPQVE